MRLSDCVDELIAAVIGQCFFFCADAEGGVGVSLLMRESTWVCVILWGDFSW